MSDEVIKNYTMELEVKKFLEKLVESFIVYCVAFSWLVALIVIVVAMSPFLIIEFVMGRR